MSLLFGPQADLLNWFKPKRRQRGISFASICQAPAGCPRQAINDRPEFLCVTPCRRAQRNGLQGLRAAGVALQCVHQAGHLRKG
jgi:hypothetical protein